MPSDPLPLSPLDELRNELLRMNCEGDHFGDAALSILLDSFEQEVRTQERNRINTALRKMPATTLLLEGYTLDVWVRYADVRAIVDEHPALSRLGEREEEINEGLEAVLDLFDA